MGKTAPQWNNSTAIQAQEGKIKFKEKTV